MAESTLEDVLNSGDINTLAQAMRRVKGGSLLRGEGGVRPVTETVDVASASATPKYTIAALLRAKTVDTGAAAEKTVMKQGATPSAGQAAANSGGTAVVFHAETTGTGTALLVYLTSDPVDGADALSADFGAGF